MVLAITGALYLFDREIEAWLYADFQPSPSRVGQPLMPLANQEVAVRAAYPDARLKRLVLPSHPAASLHASSQWIIIRPTPDEPAAPQSLVVFVDPYQARVLGAVDADTQFMAIVRDLHGTLLLGDFGSFVVEMVACWALVMITTGLYLWWPGKWRIRGTLWPRWQAQGRRFWRDIHAIPAAFAALLTLFLILSGLPWSVFWGEQFAKVSQHLAATAPSPNFGGALASHPGHNGPSPPITPSDHLGTILPWSVQHALHNKGDTPENQAISRSNPPTIDDIVAAATARGVGQAGPTVRVIYPSPKNAFYTISYIPDKAQGQRTLQIDAATGHVHHDVG
jgi:uncharacterized iron-regulated membrane protein